MLEDDIVAMPQGLETVVGPRGVRLSGGQVQRAAAARLFVRAPALLVFDDVFARASDYRRRSHSSMCGGPCWIRLPTVASPSLVVGALQYI